MSSIYGLCSECRGLETSFENIDHVRVKMEFLLPLNEIVVNFFDKLKSVTSGYGNTHLQPKVNENNCNFFSKHFSRVF